MPYLGSPVTVFTPAHALPKTWRFFCATFLFLPTSGSFPRHPGIIPMIHLPVPETYLTFGWHPTPYRRLGISCTLHTHQENRCDCCDVWG